MLSNRGGDHASEDSSIVTGGGERGTIGERGHGADGGPCPGRYDGTHMVLPAQWASAWGEPRSCGYSRRRLQPHRGKSRLPGRVLRVHFRRWMPLRPIIQPARHLPRRPRIRRKLALVHRLFRRRRLPGRPRRQLDRISQQRSCHGRIHDMGRYVSLGRATRTARDGLQARHLPAGAGLVYG